MPKCVIAHSDCGSQYCSYAYRDIIEKHELKLSMSRKGNCWDNAVAESFFHSQKVEAINDEPEGIAHLAVSALKTKNVAWLSIQFYWDRS